MTDINELVARLEELQDLAHNDPNYNWQLVHETIELLRPIADGESVVVNLALSALQQWQPIESAPKDKPILAFCVDQCSGNDCSFRNGSKRLCLYHAHAEGLSKAEPGLCVVEWGGAFDDSTHEYEGGSLPDWWFKRGSYFEEVVNPTHWTPLPAAPSSATDS